MGKLIQVKNASAVTQVTYSYDALGERITETIGSTTRERFYNTNWQMLEERVSGASTAITQFIWGLGYIDALVLTDRDADANGGTGALGQSPSTGATGLEQRLYAQQDANWNVTSLTASSGSVIERYIYDPYGAVTIMDSTWTARAGNASSYGQINLFQGGRLETASSLYTFRNRDYSTSQGRWTRQDPAGYVDGPNLYQALLGQPIGRVDPTGLDSPQNAPYSSGNVANSDSIYRPPEQENWGGMTSAPGQPQPNLVDAGYMVPASIPRDQFDYDSNDIPYSPRMVNYTPRPWERRVVLAADIVSILAGLGEIGLAVRAMRAARAAEAAAAAVRAAEAAEAASMANTARAARVGAGESAASGSAAGRAGGAAENAAAIATRGMGGRVLAQAERAEFDTFAARAERVGLQENPYRTGSWGRVDANGRFQEATRIDVCEAGQPGWRGQTHMHITGQDGHLPLTTPIPGE